MHLWKMTWVRRCCRYRAPQNGSEPWSTISNATRSPFYAANPQVHPHEIAQAGSLSIFARGLRDAPAGSLLRFGSPARRNWNVSIAVRTASDVAGHDTFIGRPRRDGH